MDLKKFNFKTDKGGVFSTLGTDKALLAEAKERDFYNGHTPYNTLFNKVFMSGGTVKFKEGLDPKFKLEAWSYCRSLMASWEPKHEEKEGICAMLMSELLEPELQENK